MLLSILITACNTTKYVKEHEHLLTKNTIRIDNKKTSDYTITDYLIQRPNNKPLGIPLGLHIYNLGNLNYDSIHQKRIQDFENRNNFWDRLLSKKQTLKSINRKKNFNNWLLTKGEEPVIVDPKKTANTAINLRTHFFNNGYFDTTVKTEVITNSKKADVLYNVNKREPYFIGDIHYFIKNKKVDSIVQLNKNQIFIKKGEQYNQDNFQQTVSTITKTLRNNGFYHFTESLISFRNIDTLAQDHITPIDIHIDNRRVKKGNSIEEIPTNVQTIKKLSVFTDYSYETRNNVYDTKKSYNHIEFYAHEKLKYRVKTLANSIFIEPNQIYNDDAVEATRRHLKSLNNFRVVKINQQELANNELATTIILTPLKKYGVGINSEIIHSNIKQVGLSGGFNFINRNLFRGAEIFQLSLQGSIFDTATKVSGTNNTSFDAYEIGIDATLEFPKFIFPLISNLIPRTMTPRTKITIGTSFQKNIGLDKQKVTGIVDYTWKPSLKNKHTVELLNAQYIKNLNINSYFNIYSSEFNQIKTIQESEFPAYNLTTDNASAFIQSIPTSFQNSNPTEYKTLKNIEKRRGIITSNNIIPAASYAFEHNSKRGLSDTRYNYFKAKVTSAGNANAFLFKTKNDQKVFENIPVSQFLKFDVDFRKFWSKSINNSLAFRTFVGIAIPTGENKDIPFISSYFAGGSNDIRAWKTYELGPGSSNSGLEFNIGNLKILSSLEYRFKIFNSIHGAIFMDAGNIWNLPNASSTASKEELFSGFKSLENIAIGTGTGIRYDFNFLVLRLDLAFKTYEPYLTENKWFSNYSLSQSVLNIGINYPF
ncbi:translocation and assembly module lipoprotein TamL [Wenyingzhuangia sp. IMCC45467]